ncbi:MAG TPA: hypothetical protein VJO54_08890 [Burkholderiales bacterium]|nr:hypothetical protein [Burkholderiales bacterium]
MSKQNVKMSALAVAAIVIGLSAALFAPAQATSEGNAVTLAAAGEVGYLPAQYVNQAKDIEPMPATF